MSTAVLVSKEEYLHTTYEPDAEYVDGVIEERCLGEYDHSSWQKALLLWFAKAEKSWNIRVNQELRLQVSPTRFRVPDITIVNRSQPIEQVVTMPPLAVIEILSPEDRIGRVLTKLGDYERMGIGTILVIDPAKREFHRYQHGDLQLLREQTVDIAGSAAKVDWRGVEALLD